MRDRTERRPPRARPWVTVHFAQSLDGRIATKAGDSRWISGQETTRFAHALRAAADAVLVGSGTALADDPLLTVRHVPGKQPLRVLLDTRGRVPPAAQLFRDTTTRTLHVTRQVLGAELPSHVERCALPVSPSGEGVHLDALLVALAERGARELLVEGGRGVITSFLREGLVDRLVVTVAPLVIGEGIEAVGDLGTRKLDQALRLELRRVLHVGGDVLLELAREGAPPLPIALPDPAKVTS
ncbi:RibD family protein [Polyangium spumosum]|uniref:5-amino-6-(5-phosphoribosylamino)uracil reductase n=1 Tax=Polyangium spumosum TaxID=889282 RepID=A0A6N7PST2_9BACT|nr:RibD family protein [Polyangium spumosum]MRG91931.1 5-amino-6-(5-phosphoribosylamino)uracil reductase [Polyangium spumosum]